MKGNSQLIVIAICAALCTGMLHLLGVFDLQDKGLSGWNPNSMYNGVIAMDTNVYGISMVDRPSVGNTSRVTTSMPSVATGSIRSNKISALPSSKVISSSVSSSYVGAPLRTTSSASYRSFGGGGYAGGANNTFVFKQGASANNVSRINNSISSSSYAAHSNTSLYAAMPNSAVSSAMLASMRTSTSSISRAMPGMSTSRASAAMFAPKKAPGVGTQDWGSWLDGLNGNTEAGWLYNGGDYMYYDIVALKNWFDSLRDENGNVVIDGVGYTWEDFLAWFFKNGTDASGGYGDENDWWRLPLSDGVGVLIVFAIINMIVIYLRSRGKKTDTLTV